MGQQEVFSFLVLHKGKWYSTKDVADKLSVSLGSVTNNLKKLRKTESVIKFKVVGNKYLYCARK